MWREKKAEESLKNSVLDEESAARFSTAAAQAAGRHAKVSNAAQAGLMAARETSPDIVRIPSALNRDCTSLPVCVCMHKFACTN